MSPVVLKVSEELVAIAYTDDDVTNEEKSQMVKALKIHPTAAEFLTNSEQKVNLLQTSRLKNHYNFQQTFN